jgi:hypothetical protein
MNIIYIFSVLIFYINCQYWFDEINGFNEGEGREGYAGSANALFADFYLCYERKYRVHYQNDATGVWSQEFTACQPVGVGRHIDAIAISGGLQYNCHVQGMGWLGRVTGYDVFERKNGYAGNTKNIIQCITIEGGDYYRSGYNLTIESSNEFFVAKRVIYNLFQEETTDLNYENETEINIGSKFNISVILLNTSKINLEGKITVKVETSKIISANYNGLMSDNLKKRINKVIDFDYDKIKFFLENKFYKEGLRNGTVAINSKWSENLIEIDAGSKITGDHYSYRGGFRFLIRLKDDIELLSKIQNILKTLFRFSGKKIPKELLSDFNSFKQIEPLMNELGINSIIAEEIILYLILNPVLIY